MHLRAAPRFAFAALLLAGCVAASQLNAQVAEPAAAAPETAFPAASTSASTTTTTTVTKTVKKKKKRSHDFKKKHAPKKSKAAKKERLDEVDLNAVPGATVTGAAPGERRGYDPAINEPTEEVMAIKNTAERKYWEGKRPLNGGPVPASQDVAQQPLPMSNPNSLERVSASDLAGVTFDDQPFRMPPSPAFQNSIDTVATELGRPCKSREYFGWPLAQTEQERVNHIFNDTIVKFRLRGYAVNPRKAHTTGSDISVFTADRQQGGYSSHVLGLWSAGDVGLLLLVCDSDAPADYIAAQKHTAEELAKAKKAKKKKKTVRKKAVKHTEEKPKVVPGTASSTELTPPAPEAASSATQLVPVPAASPATTAPAPAPEPAAVAPAPVPVTTTTTTTTTVAPAAVAPASPSSAMDTPPPAVKSDAAPPQALPSTPPPAAPAAAPEKGSSLTAPAQRDSAAPPAEPAARNSALAPPAAPAAQQ